jgi:hypothetical protein
MSNLEANKATALRLVEVFNGRQLGARIIARRGTVFHNTAGDPDHVRSDAADAG